MGIIILTADQQYSVRGVATDFHVRISTNQFMAQVEWQWQAHNDKIHHAGHSTRTRIPVYNSI